MAWMMPWRSLLVDGLDNDFLFVGCELVVEIQHGVSWLDAGGVDEDASCTAGSVRVCLVAVGQDARHVLLLRGVLERT